MLTHNTPPQCPRHRTASASFAAREGRNSDPEDAVQPHGAASLISRSCPAMQREAGSAPGVKLTPCRGAHTRFATLFNPAVMPGKRGTVGDLKESAVQLSPRPSHTVKLQHSVAPALAPIRSAWRGIWEDVRGGSAGPTLLQLCWKRVPTYGVQMGHSPFSRLQPANKLGSSWGGEPPEPHVL